MLRTLTENTHSYSFPILPHNWEAYIHFFKCALKEKEFQQKNFFKQKNRGETNGTLNSGGNEDHYMTGWRYCTVEKGFAAPESNMEDLSQSFSCVWGCLIQGSVCSCLSQMKGAAEVCTGQPVSPTWAVGSVLASQCHQHDPPKGSSSKGHLNYSLIHFQNCALYWMFALEWIQSQFAINLNNL